MKIKKKKTKENPLRAVVCRTLSHWQRKDQGMLPPPFPIAGSEP